MNKVSNIFILLLVVIFVGFAQDNRKGCTLSDYITTFSEDQVLKNKTGWAFWFIPSKGVADTLSVKMSCVDKMLGTHDPHAHFEDELFLMVKGTAIVHLNGEEQKISEGTSFYAPGNSSHSIRRIDENAPIWYVMFKRETPGGLKVPFLPGIKEYSMKDCIVPFSEAALTREDNERTMWYLKKEMSTGGLSTRLHIPTDTSMHQAEISPIQEVYFVLEGTAKVTVNGKSRVITALSSCYCPPNSTHSIQKEGDKTLKYLVVRTK